MAVDVPPPDRSLAASPSPLFRLARAAARPIEAFLRIEAASGVLLLLCAAVALGCANSPWGEAFLGLWHSELGLQLGGRALSLEWLVNDGLMVIFFFVVGLEIRREVHHGELSQWRRAALPAAAALGGMLAPALLYLSVAASPPTHSGWGVPMATDIAFAVGILTLLGPRVPAALRVLLLALAVIDDLGAILVIALFYSAGVSASGLLLAAAGLVLILVMQRFGVRSQLAYLVPALVVWAGVHHAGIHPTIAGVLVGLITPVDVSESLITRLHPWVAYAIMPLFALANAGVSLSGVTLDAESQQILGGVSLGLIAGKPLGVLIASWLCLRLGVASLPQGLGLRELLVLGVVAGVGFTMSLFVAQLAFGDPKLLAAAKLAVLVASAVAGVLALAVGRVLLPRRVPAAAQSADEP